VVAVADEDGAGAAVGSDSALGSELSADKERSPLSLRTMTKRRHVVDGGGYRD